MTSVVWAASPDIPEQPGPQIVIFPDAILAALRIVRESSVSELSSVEFGTREPHELGAEFRGVPYVAFHLLSSDASGHPFREVASLLIKAWGDTEAQSLRLLQIVRGVLTAYEGDSEVGSISAGVGPLTVQDTENGHPLSSAGVRIRLRPIVL